MKIAVLADIHANLPALHTVATDIERWQPDRVIVAGDIVNRGPHPAECLGFVQRMARERGWLVLRGNHEEYVMTFAAHQHDPANAQSPQRDLLSPTRWTHSQIADQVAALHAMPTQIDLPVRGGGLLAVRHASIHHNRDGLLDRHSDATLLSKIDPAATVFCTGHTHMPFVRRIGATLIVNVGSVGLPFDSDTRAAYARITLTHGHWHAEIVRLAYDLAHTQHDFRHGGLFDALGVFGPMMYYELTHGATLLYDFMTEFKEPILKGQIELGQAADRFMADFRT